MVQAIEHRHAMLRPQIAADDDLRDRVNEYAEQEGIRMPRAYSELLEKGLQQQGIPRTK